MWWRAEEKSLTIQEHRRVQVCYLSGLMKVLQNAMGEVDVLRGIILIRKYLEDLVNEAFEALKYTHGYA
jgi:hypothetical protein